MRFLAIVVIVSDTLIIDTEAVHRYTDISGHIHTYICLQYGIDTSYDFVWILFYTPLTRLKDIAWF